MIREVITLAPGRSFIPRRPPFGVTTSLIFTAPEALSPLPTVIRKITAGCCRPPSVWPILQPINGPGRRVRRVWPMRIWLGLISAGLVKKTLNLEAGLHFLKASFSASIATLSNPMGWVMD